MKRLMPYIMGTLLLSATAAPVLAAEELQPGQVDFGTFSPPGGNGEFVEVNVPSGLLSLAARLVEQDQPEVAKVLGGLKLVRVNVIGLDEANRAELQTRASKVRKDLASKGWERVVTAQQKGQDVSVYLKLSDTGAVQGLAAVVLDGKEHAVFANIVGDIKPEQLAMLGEKFHIDPLRHLGMPGNHQERKTGEKAEE